MPAKTAGPVVGVGVAFWVDLDRVANIRQTSGGDWPQELPIVPCSGMRGTIVTCTGGARARATEAAGETARELASEGAREPAR